MKSRPFPANSHEQVWVKVNAPVDRGIAQVVTALSKLNDLQAVDSCQGEPNGGKAAHVYFYYRDWRSIGELVFERIEPALHAKVGSAATVSVEVFNGSNPMGKLSFDAEATDMVASALDQIL